MSGRSSKCNRDLDNFSVVSAIDIDANKSLLSLVHVSWAVFSWLSSKENFLFPFVFLVRLSLSSCVCECHLICLPEIVQEGVSLS